MKRVVVILLIIILLIAVVLGVLFLLPDENVVEPPIPSGDIVVKEPSEEVIVNTAITKTQTQKRLVNVEMPYFMELSDYSFQEAVNSEIASLINPYINEIAIVADETISKQYEYTVTYDRYNNGDYVSLLIAQSYMTGGMRSNEWKDTYTIDVIKNKVVTLADICGFNNYKEVIVTEINKQAKEKNLDLIAGNGLADIPDSQRFYIKDKKLYIYFEPASIAPYLDGEMHFEMPYKFIDGEFVL